MKTKVLLLLLVLCSVQAHSQGKVKVKLIQPPPNLLGVKDIWNVTVQNLSREEAEINLEGTVDEAQDGRIVDGSCGYFKLKPNETKTITANNIPGGGKYSWSNTKYQEQILRTGSAGSGRYTICIYAKDKSGKELSRDCKQQMIAVSGPPTLVAPANGTKLKAGELPVFMWLPPAPETRGIKYTLKIVEITGNQTAVEALQRNTAWLEKRDLATTTFQYQPSARALEKEKKYAWKVSAGQGESEAFEFSTTSTPGQCDIDIESITPTCNGWTNEGKPKYQVQVVVKNNLSVGVTYLGHGIATDNNGDDSPSPTTGYGWVFPTAYFTASGWSPGSNVTTTIPPNGTITITFQMVQETANNTFTLKILARTFVTLDNHTTGNECSSTKDCELPPCYCHDCESAVMTADLVQASQVSGNPHQYNISGTLAINGLPQHIQAVEMQVKSYSFSSTPSSCSAGVDILQHSGVIMKPSTTINGIVPVFSNLTTTNDYNVAKDVKLIIGGAGMTQPASIPFTITMGLPAPLPGMTPECCRMTYTVCFKVIVWYGKSPDICRYCQFFFCKTFSNN